MIAFMFSGQGAQYKGMGKELYDNFPEAKEIFDKANESLKFNISDVCFNDTENLLDKTEYTQPAVLTAGIASYEIIKKYIRPDCCLGLSLGEYSALVASESLNFEEAVCLVKKRGRFMTEACPEGVGAMSAVMNGEAAIVKEACREAEKFGIVSTANFNMPGQIVIAGEKKAVEEAEKIVLAKGAKKCIRLNVSGAFHTKLLKPAADKLKKEFETINFKEMKIPVISNFTGNIIEKKEDIPTILENQVMNSVLWETSVNTLLGFGVTTFIELGPGKTLNSFVKKIAKKSQKDVLVLNIEDLKSYEKTISELKV